MEDKLENGRKVRILNVIDEFTRECLASEVAFSIKQHDVIELLRYLLLVRGGPIGARFHTRTAGQTGPRSIRNTPSVIGWATTFLSWPGTICRFRNRFMMQLRA
jgi:putative transposase